MALGIQRELEVECEEFQRCEEFNTLEDAYHCSNVEHWQFIAVYGCIYEAKVSSGTKLNFGGYLALDMRLLAKMLGQYSSIIQSRKVPEYNCSESSSFWFRVSVLLIACVLLPDLAQFSFEVRKPDLIIP